MRFYFPIPLSPFSASASFVGLWEVRSGKQKEE